jgi:predicted MFS family arabinose efflux permease
MSDRVPGLWLISLAAFCSMASMRVCDPMLLALSQDFEISVGEASRVVSAFAVAYGCLQLFYGPLGDRIGKLRVVNAAVLACAVFSLLTALVGDFEWLVAARALMGASAAGIIPLSMAWVGDQVRYERRQETLARLMSATVTGMMAGQWFGGWAAQSLGWRSAFVALSLLFALAATLMLVRMAPQRRAAARQTSGSYWQQALSGLGLLRLPRVRWVLAVTTLEGALAFGTLAFVPSQLERQLGLSAMMAGALMALYGIGGLLYSQMARRWLAWLGERGLAATGGALVGVGLLLLAWAQHVAPAALGCVLAGLGFYMLHNTLQTQATQMAPEARGSAVTLFAGMLFFGQSAGVLLTAQTVDRGGLEWAFSLAALGMLALGLHVATRVSAPRTTPA